MTSINLSTTVLINGILTTEYIDQTNLAVVVNEDFCSPCHLTCASACTGPNSNDCIDCVSVRNTTVSLTTWLEAGQTVENYGPLAVNNPAKNCVESCTGNNTYLEGSSNICRPCHAACQLGCVGLTRSDCLFCPRFTDFKTRNCVDWCNTNQFLSNRVCYDCNSNCNTSSNEFYSPGVFLHGHGDYLINKTAGKTLRIKNATNLSFEGTYSCRKVVIGAKGQTEETDFINITHYSGNSSMRYPLLLPNETFSLGGSPPGLTKLKVRVTAEDRVSVTEYHLRVIRSPATSLLSLLDVGLEDSFGSLVAIDPPFNTAITSYEIQLHNAVNSVMFRYTSSRYNSLQIASSANFFGIFPGVVSTAVSINVTRDISARDILEGFSVSVITEDMIESAPYIFYITRIQPIDETFFTTLSVRANTTTGVVVASEMTPLFSPGLLVYTVFVPYRSTAVLVKGTPNNVYSSHPNYTTSSNPQGSAEGVISFEEGSNVTIKATLSSESGRHQITYIIVVHRAQKSNIMSLNNFVLVANDSSIIRCVLFLSFHFFLLTSFLTLSVASFSLVLRTGWTLQLLPINLVTSLPY